MKKMLKKICVMTMLAFVMVMLTATVVSAKTFKEKWGAAKNLSKKYMIYYGAADGITDIKVSNTKVVELVRNQVNDETIEVYLKLKKYGKTKLSYKIRHDGVTDTYKTTLTVFKYKNPFKTLKIGKKNIASGFKKKTLVQVPENTKGKLKISLKKDWKVAGLYTWVAEKEAYTKKVKLSKKITINKDHPFMLNLKHRKDGFIWCFYFGCWDEI